MKTRPLFPRIQSKQVKLSDYQQVSSLETENYSPTCSMSMKKLRRKRKNNEQVSILIEKYNQSTSWTKEEVCSLAQTTGLSEAQVYKWCWDYKKKLNRIASRLSIAGLVCGEIMAPSQIDLEMAKLQRLFKEDWTSYQHFAE